MIKVGDKFKTTSGGDCVVIDYKNSDNILVEFIDKNAAQLWTNSYCLRKGQIKNPCFPIIFDKGYFGQGNYKSKIGSTRNGAKPTKHYATWVNMLSRCYDPNYICTKSYTGSEVHEDWLNFQTFANWYETQQIFISNKEMRFALDKDVLGFTTEVKFYSENTCCLLPIEINALFKPNNKDGQFLRGVTPYCRGFKVNNSYTGSVKKYDNELDAHIDYLNSKIQIIRGIADHYRDNLRPDVYNALKFKDFRYMFSSLYAPNHENIFENIELNYK